MANTVERKTLTKERSSFTLIGRAKRNDDTFKIDSVYNSGWQDSSMHIGIDCGNGNVVYADMRGGFFRNSPMPIKVFGKERTETGKSNMIEVDWNDRFDDSKLDIISDSSLFTVGLEKDIDDRTVYKKFLSAYDAVNYIKECLTNNMIVNVKGNISYSEYDGNVSIKKEITSIVLSKAESDEDFKATFTQTILVDNNSIGTKDSEKNTIELNAYVVDYVGSPKINGSKVAIKQNIVFPVHFEVGISEAHPEITEKMLKKYFKPKKRGLIDEITVVGNLIESGSVVTIKESDIPDDIKELIEAGLYDMSTLQQKKAVGSGGNRERRMVIIKPDIRYVERDGDNIPVISYEPGKYEDTDLCFYEQALIEVGVLENAEENVNNIDDTDNVLTDEDESLLELLGM